MIRFRDHDCTMKLEIAFVVTVLLLIVQLFPGVLTGLDVRTWSRSTWFAVNIIVVALLLSARFIPDLWAEWRARQIRLAVLKAKRKKDKELKDQIDAMRRLKESRSRRIY